MAETTSIYKCPACGARLQQDEVNEDGSPVFLLWCANLECRLPSAGGTARGATLDEAFSKIQQRELVRTQRYYQRNPPIVNGEVSP